jgi:hypothetical protein
MKIQIITSAAGPDGIFKKGAILDLPQETAQPLIDCGVARLLADKPVETREKAAAPAPFQKREKRKQ